MAKTTLSKVTISKDNANIIVNRVIDGLKVVNKGYLAIAGDVNRLYDTKAYEVLGYENFDKMCADLFDMSHGTTVGIRKVFGVFGSKSSKTGEYTISEKYLDFGYTKLLLFATDKAKFDAVNINPIEEFDPKMTIGEIKATLKGLLEDKAKIQDENAIDTDGSIIDNSESNESNESNESIEKSDKDVIQEMIVSTKALMLTMSYLKPEKACLLEAIEANLKELKKLAK